MNGIACKGVMPGVKVAGILAFGGGGPKAGKWRMGHTHIKALVCGSGEGMAERGGSGKSHRFCHGYRQCRPAPCRIGRPYVTAAYGGGAEGVALYTEKLKAELKDAMTNCATLAEITKEKIRMI